MVCFCVNSFRYSKWLKLRLHIFYWHVLQYKVTSSNWFKHVCCPCASFFHETTNHLLFGYSLKLLSLSNCECQSSKETPQIDHLCCFLQAFGKHNATVIWFRLSNISRYNTIFKNLSIFRVWLPIDTTSSPATSEYLVNNVFQAKIEVFSLPPAKDIFEDYWHFVLILTPNWKCPALFLQTDSSEHA